MERSIPEVHVSSYGAQHLLGPGSSRADSAADVDRVPEETCDCPGQGKQQVEGDQEPHESTAGGEPSGRVLRRRRPVQVGPADPAGVDEDALR